MENPILFPLGIFPASVRHIVESLQKYEHYQVDFTAVSFFTAFAAAMGNTWSARFMTGWVSRPILYVVLVGPPSCGKTPPLRQAVAPLLKLDEASDRIYAQEIRQYRTWEKLTAKQRKQQSLPEEMEMPQRKCHVVVNSTIEALVSALRDNPRGVLIYNDEIDSLLSNFNRYSGSDESYFLSLFSVLPSNTPASRTTSTSSCPILTAPLSAPPNPVCSPRCLVGNARRTAFPLVS